MKVQNNQQGKQGMQFYSPTSGNIPQSQGMPHYPSYPPSPPGLSIGAFPASPPIDYQIMSTAPPWAQVLVRHVSDIKTRMQKLDQIEHAVFDTRNALKHVDKSVRDLTTRVNILETQTKSVENCYSAQKSLEKSVNKIKNNTTTQTEILTKLQKEFENLELENRKLACDNAKIQDELLNIKCHAMKDNLLFFNLEESETENCTKVIQNFCKENLRLMEAENFEFESVYRFGKSRNSRGRPILAKFKNFRDREAVRKASHKLRDSAYSISEQLPQEYRERRKLLLPQYKQAKGNNQRAHFVRDKLFIDGKLVTSPNTDIDDDDK